MDPFLATESKSDEQVSSPLTPAGWNHYATPRGMRTYEQLVTSAHARIQNKVWRNSTQDCQSFFNVQNTSSCFLEFLFELCGVLNKPISNISRTSVPADFFCIYSRPPFRIKGVLLRWNAHHSAARLSVKMPSHVHVLL